MSKKIKRYTDGLVYSTGGDFETGEDTEEIQTPEPRLQKLIIRLETKQRGGKKATLISGFTGRQEDLEVLARQLRNHCGAGGSTLGTDILVQGDMVQKVKAFLWSKGYKTNNI